MDDSINREDAIREAENLLISSESIYLNDLAYGNNQAIYHVIDRIEALPSADRPQGKWIRTGRTNIYGGIEVQCSNCGDRVMVQHLEDEWYCRHCGADMGMKGADDGSTL